MSTPLSPVLASEAAARAARPSMVGAWRLHQGHAMSLRPRHTAELRIVRGRVWVTLGGPYHGAANQLGDRFLQAGDSIRVPAGSRLVMEPYEPGSVQTPVHFAWTDAPTPLQTRFAREVLAPSREVVAALGHTATALARLVRGLLGYGGYLATGARGDRARSAYSGSCE